jgi:protein lifeguard
MLGMVSSYHNTQTVQVALIITIFVVLGVTLFSMQTKIDFTRHWFTIFCLSLAFISFTFVFLILTWFSSIAQAIYGGIGALLMILFLAIDTQMLIGGKRRFQFSQEDYVYVALQIYLDICYIFIYILTAISSQDKS